MKSKLAALLAALLLSFSLLPTQALAASLPDPSTPPAISVPEELETPDTPSDPDEPENPVPQSNISEHPGDPDRPIGEH